MWLAGLTRAGLLHAGWKGAPAPPARAPLLRSAASGTLILLGARFPKEARNGHGALALDDFYKEYILDHYRNPRNFGHLEHPTAKAEDLNPLCGDTITMELKVNAAGIVEDIAFSGKGCAISQASASMLTELIRGEKLEDVAKLQQQVVLDNVGFGITPARMKCAMLGLKVLKSAALGEIATWPDEAPPAP